MKIFTTVFITILLTAPVFALTATNLAGFEGIEEPVVKYIVAEKKFVPDDFTNITDAGSNTVRMTLRFHADDWWDGDRDRHDTSRQRAEVKGIGPHQKNGETFEYATTWRQKNLADVNTIGSVLPLAVPAHGVVLYRLTAAK
jgi:hypothetical protein